jgi:Flp pilus assembly protein TadD
MAEAKEDLLAEYKEDFALLIEAGFVAVKQLDEKSARQIFKAAQVLSPHSTAPHIGLGFIALNKLDTKESDRIFAKIVEREPDNWLAQTFLGISHLLQKSKRKQGEELVRLALESSSDVTVKNLAKVTLEWLEKELKKKDSKAPFFKE